MNNKKVSVIILTYNRADFVIKAVNSVLAQSYKDFELLIIDDGSEDNTLKLLDKINDPRVKVFPLVHSGHIAKLRNFGIENSKAGLISFLDSDDLWDTEYLENLITEINKNNNLGFVFSDVEVMKYGKILQKNIYKNLSDKDEGYNLFYKLIAGELIPIRPSTLLFKRICLKETGIYNEILLVGDYNFLLRLTYKFDGKLCGGTKVKVIKHNENISDIIQIKDFIEVIYTIEEFYENKAIDKRLYKSRLYFFHFMILKKLIKKGNAIKALNQLLMIANILFK